MLTDQSLHASLSDPVLSEKPPSPPAEGKLPHSTPHASLKGVSRWVTASSLIAPSLKGNAAALKSLTPELDREQEAWETILAYAHSQVTRLERQRWEARRAAEEAAAYGVEVACG